MAFKIKRVKVAVETHHIGTWSLPSDHAISAHCTIMSGQPPKWVYSEDPKGLKPEDQVYWDRVIFATLNALLKEKTGVNRRASRRLAALQERAVGHLSRQ